jgi:hypothetical protein
MAVLLCGVVMGVSVFAGPAHAEFESKSCKKSGAAWKKGASARHARSKEG